MTLGSDIAAALPGLRAEARSRMTSTVLVESVEAGTDWDTATDAVVATVVHEELPCRVKTAGATGADRAKAGPATVAYSSPEIHFEWDVPGLRVGHRATVLASESPALVGQVFRLVQPPDGEQMTAQRWEVESWTTSGSS